MRGSSNKKLINNNSNSVTNSLKTNSTLTNNDKLNGDNSCNNLTSKIMGNHVDTNDADDKNVNVKSDDYDDDSNGRDIGATTGIVVGGGSGGGGSTAASTVGSVATTTMMKLKNECVGLANANKIEEFLDKTVTGIVELKDDLLRMNEDSVDIMFLNTEGLRKRNNFESSSTNGGGIGVGTLLTSASDNNTSVDKFLKKEIDALNAAVQQANVLPAVLSNGHAK